MTKFENIESEQENLKKIFKSLFINGLNTHNLKEVWQNRSAKDFRHDDVIVRTCTFGIQMKITNITLKLKPLNRAMTLNVNTLKMQRQD